MTMKKPSTVLALALLACTTHAQPALPTLQWDACP